MQWLKFKNIVVCFSFVFGMQISAMELNYTKFTADSCLRAKYETDIENQGKFFGLLKNKLTVGKDVCELEIKFKSIFETLWQVDVCREPVHLKVTSKGNLNVYKRDKKCDKNDKSDFCYFRNELITQIEDQGLIFAKGIRENIQDDHGKIYCAYLLLKDYLDDAHIYSLSSHTAGSSFSKSNIEASKPEPFIEKNKKEDSSLLLEEKTEKAKSLEALPSEDTSNKKF